MSRRILWLAWAKDGLQALGAAVGSVWREGFSHAGNLAYLALLTLLPFFVLVAAAAGALGRTGMGARFVGTVLSALPPDVSALLEAPAREVIERPASGSVVTLGVLLVLWTVSSYAEAVRDIIRRAHGAAPTQPIWRYRLLSLLVVLGGVLLMLLALAAQVVLTGIETFMLRLLPMGAERVAELGLNRLLPAALLFAGLALALFGLTPSRLRRPHWLWPGALLVTAWWVGATMAMPILFAQFMGASIAYGSLGGVIVTLLYFWVLGLGLVFGTHFNAALAKAGQTRLKPGSETTGWIG
ncbi:membrane protein [Polymorphobacter multimanifer]|uniref:Membrane protein n=1 Tax=Polymorphobacter multimanifer TaxID=1070431 RepID=A0A841L5H5_9SPHN|nr:YhjD/YihY/BrkB family envelope integrity protein [Polymorphobacter multimanifer]MBB6227854.1 membrane protein [Polymorphobacter multimanifer]